MLSLICTFVVSDLNLTMNRYCYIVALLLFFASAAHASIVLSGTDFVAEKANESSGIDSIFVVKSLEDVKITYIIEEGASADKFKWYSLDISGTETLLKEESEDVSESSVSVDATQTALGYVIKGSSDEQLAGVWLFLYSAYSPGNMSVDYEYEDRCGFVDLIFKVDDVQMKYMGTDGSGELFKVKQQYMVAYDSTYYESESYITEEVKYYVDEASLYSIPAPLDSTTFKVFGTKFTMAFKDTLTVESDPYKPFVVELHVLSSVRVREYATNELDRGEPREAQEEIVRLKGSAPLNIEALTYASPAAYHYKWVLSTDKEYKAIIAKMKDKDFRYSFDKKGTYYLRVEVSNASIIEDEDWGCTQVKEFVIEVLESALDVPNVFTPNGDGKNDMFKVAYKSLVSFHGSVYNVWGRLIYDWTDPADGWDGTINGSPAPDGAYLYIIEAVGDDEDEEGNPMRYLKKGSVTLVR